MKTINRTPYLGLALLAVVFFTTIGCLKPMPQPYRSTTKDSAETAGDVALVSNTTSASFSNTTTFPNDMAFGNTTSFPNSTQPFTLELDPNDRSWARTLPTADPGETDTEPTAVAVAPVLPPGMNRVPIPLVLPAPAFRGTPVELTEPNVEKPRGKPREPFRAPEGTVNLALGRSVSSSDPAPTTGELDLITDGDKEATDFGCLELHPGAEWVQVDLGQKSTVWAVVLWHNHAQARVYRDVIVQISDDPDFLDAFTVFNNDYDNSSGMGTANSHGKLNKGYVETSEGLLVDSGGAEGRYVRLYSRGNTIDAENHYTEVEVYGVPQE